MKGHLFGGGLFYVQVYIDMCAGRRIVGGMVTISDKIEIDTALGKAGDLYMQVEAETGLECIWLQKDEALALSKHIQKLHKQPTMSVVLRYLQKDEWTMGNGQCDECCGLAPIQVWERDETGHEKGCGMATAIESLGGSVKWKEGK